MRPPPKSLTPNQLEILRWIEIMGSIEFEENGPRWRTWLKAYIPDGLEGLRWRDVKGSVLIMRREGYLERRKGDNVNRLFMSEQGRLALAESRKQ